MRPKTIAALAAPAPTGPALHLPALLEHRATELGDRVALLWRAGGTWRSLSWSGVEERSRALASGLFSLGVAPGDRVALFADTTVEALLAMLAALSAGAVVVPLYPATPPAECAELLSRSGARVLFCGGEERLRAVGGPGQATSVLEVVIRIDDTPGPGRDFAWLEAIGRSAGATGERTLDLRRAGLGPGELAAILFTSGTTGAAKGVMLTHGGWVYAGANATGLDVMRPDDRALLFLPLAHAFAWLVISGWLHAGCELALGAIDRIASDAAEIRPTFVPGPPRVFEKVLAGAVASGCGQAGPRGWLFRWAMAAFERWSAAQDRGEPCRDPRVLLARGLVLQRAGRAVSHRLGGRIRLLLSGSAPLSPRIGRFFESIGLDLIEGYGMTETSAGSVVNRPGRARHGTVGQPVPGTEVALAADGEVLIRGPGLMRGYWMDPEATAAALKDGWMHTGDIGALDAEGTLRIVDRKKDLIITSGGMKVAPQRLERELEADPLVSHALVHGNRRPYLTAVLALDEAAARRWASSAGLAPGEALFDSGAVRARLQATVDAVNARLPRYATLKRFAILRGDFTVLGGDLTPTLKLRRAVCEQHLGTVLDALYRS